jgi:hypothetical protein
VTALDSANELLRTSGSKRLEPAAMAAALAGLPLWLFLQKPDIIEAKADNDAVHNNQQWPYFFGKNQFVRDAQCGYGRINRAPQAHFIEFCLSFYGDHLFSCAFLHESL